MSKQPVNTAYGAHLEGYAGIPSFMRQPATRELEGVDVAIVGVPYDAGSANYRSGPRMGPRAIREAFLRPSFFPCWPPTADAVSEERDGPME